VQTWFDGIVKQAALARGSTGAGCNISAGTETQRYLSVANDRPSRRRGLRPGDLYPTHDGVVILLQAEFTGTAPGLLLRKADAKC
jgi:hypothetical protein